MGAGEFKKCGEIMFAAKCNKIAMRCNFCDRMFKQMQAFVRHLHMEHTDEVAFVKHIKEVEVYAFEELMNQTGNSCPSDVDSDDSESDCLSDKDIRWLDEGISPTHQLNDKEKFENTSGGKKCGSNLSNHEDDFNVTNTSILKALEECDVSFDTSNKSNITHLAKDEQVRVSLSKETEEDCGTTSEKDDSEDLDSSELVLQVSNESMTTTLATNNSFGTENKKTIKENIEKSPIKCIKKLLQGLEDFDDVDNLLDDIEQESDAAIDKLKENICQANEIYQEDVGITNSYRMQSTNIVEKNATLEEFKHKAVSNAVETKSKANTEIPNKSCKGDVSVNSFPQTLTEHDVIEKKDTLEEKNNTSDSNTHDANIDIEKENGKDSVVEIGKVPQLEAAIVIEKKKVLVENTAALETKTFNKNLIEKKDILEGNTAALDTKTFNTKDINVDVQTENCEKVASSNNKFAQIQAVNVIEKKAKLVGHISNTDSITFDTKDNFKADIQNEICKDGTSFNNIAQNLAANVEGKTNTAESNIYHKNDNFHVEIEKVNCENGVSSTNNLPQSQAENLVEKRDTIEDNHFDDIQIEKATNLVESNDVNTESSCLENFAACLQELQRTLTEDMLNSHDDSIDKLEIETDNLIDNFEQKLKDLEVNLTADINDNQNKAFDNNKAFYIDLKNELAHLTEPENNSTALEDKSLNEDLTKALVDALDGEDLDLLNLQLDDESEEPLNKDILDLLERELLDKELEKDLPEPHQPQQIYHNKPSSNDVLREEKSIKPVEAESKNTNSTDICTSSKFQKTNLKAKEKSFEQLPSVLKESNCINRKELAKDSQKPVKDNPRLLVNRPQFSPITSAMKSPAKTVTHKNTNTPKMPKQIRQSKTPNKENANVNVQKTKNTKLTPDTSFINMARGNRTPLKKEDVFPKTQDIVQQNLTSKLQNCKSSQKGQKIVMRQTLPQLKNKAQLNPSPKYQQKGNELPEKKNSPLTTEIRNNKNPQQPVQTQHNTEQPSTPSKTVLHAGRLNYVDRTPLTTPSRKLKNVAIKLKRCTPDKLINAFKNSSTSDNVNRLAEKFKLPKGITMTAVTIPNSKDEHNQPDIVETPIKTATYCQQNFSESSVKQVQLKSSAKPSKDNHQVSPTTAESKIMKAWPTRKQSDKLRQRVASIDIARTAKQDVANASHKTPRHSNLDYKSYAVSRSSRKREVLQRMRNIKKQIFKSIEGSESLNKFKNKQMTNLIIENVKILPNMDKETLKSLVFNDFKKPILNNCLTKAFSAAQEVADVPNSAHNEAEKSTKTTRKRCATSPLLEANDLTKRPHISPSNKQNAEKTSVELEKTQIDLSESCVDFLQRDLKASRLNVESLFNSEISASSDGTSEETSAEANSDDETSQEPILSDEAIIMANLLEQVANESSEQEEITQKECEAEKTEASTSCEQIKEFEESQDIDLLAKFGLKIIKIPDIEDVILLEERDKMNEKARKFANIYNKWQRVWSSKNCESPTFKAELLEHFKGLLTEVNAQFKLKLNMVKIKRLVNLISFWFVQNVSSKLIEKRKISEAMHRYLTYFFFIPKASKRFYYCEYCEEYYNTEHKYYTHRMIHTGALYPYKCQKCALGFKIIKQLKAHELSCSTMMDQPTSCTPLTPTTVPNIKCSVCDKIFETPELLHKHSKTHLNSIYRCAKCDTLFTSGNAVKEHMNLCNAVNKRVQPCGTPRPTKIRKSLLN